MREFAVLENPDLLFARLGVALARKAVCRITYGLEQKEVDFTPHRIFTIDGKLTCSGTVENASARIHIDITEDTAGRHATPVITLPD